MSYITPSQFRSGLEETKEYVDSRVVSAGGGNANIQHSYIVGEKAFRNDWLSDTNGGDAITPVADNTVYFIRTEGEFFGETYYWDVGKNVYRLVGKKNVANVPYKEVRNFSAEDRSLSPRELAADRYNLLTIPVVTGTIIHTNITGSCRSFNLFFGFEGDTTVSQWFGSNTGSWLYDGSFSFIKDIEVTEEIASLNVPFKIYVYAGGQAGQYARLDNCEIIVEKVFRDFETPTYVPPTSTADGQSGLVPSISKDNTTAEALTPQGWDAIDFDITKDDIRTAFEESYGTVTPKGQIYSLEEQVIGQWIDGKPLYRKTVPVNSETTKGIKTITINIASVETAMIDFSHSFIINQSTKEHLPIMNCWDSGNTGGYSLTPSANSIRLLWYRNIWQQLTGYITLEYTKTTDTV